MDEALEFGRYLTRNGWKSKNNWQWSRNSEIETTENLLSDFRVGTPLPKIKKDYWEYGLNELALVERYADNGEFNHYELIDLDTGKIVWPVTPLKLSL